MIILNSFTFEFIGGKYVKYSFSLVVGQIQGLKIRTITAGPLDLFARRIVGPTMSEASPTYFPRNFFIPNIQAFHQEKQLSQSDTELT